MYHPEISKLIVKHLNATLTPREQQILDEWRTSSEDNEKLFVKLTDQTYLSQKLKIMQEIGVGAEWADVRRTRRPGILRVLPQAGWQRLSAAVVIGIIILGTGFYFFPTKNQQLASNPVNKAAKTIFDVIPSGNKASLILSDGHSIELDQAQNGILTEQEGVSVSKQEGGIIAYAAADATASSAVYNTLRTLRSNQYQVILPDGSHAWLNAASSIKYPVRFNEKERVVEVTGEVYFEVQKQYALDTHKKIPFKVLVPKGEIQVLGTHFDVKSYEEEGITSTTLLEGSVRFQHGNNSAMLKPGQQSRLSNSGSITVVKGVDTMQAVDWKNGVFNFKDCSMKTIMNELTRWYDVEDVVYNSYNPNKHFKTSASRNNSLSQILNKLKATHDVDFQIDGKRIIVMM